MTATQNTNVTGQVFDHTIHLPMNVPIGSEFELYPLYGLSKSEFDSLKINNALSFPTAKYCGSAMIGLFLPDAYKAYQAQSLKVINIDNIMFFTLYVLAAAVVLELIRISIFHWCPVTDGAKMRKNVADHFKKNKPHRTRSQ